MGWLYMPRQSLGGHASAKSYLDAQFTHERPQEEGGSRGLKVLASACPGNRVYYAATQVMTNGVGGEIFAIVCLVRWNPRDKEGMILGYKDMEESMGPCEDGCPAHILDLLTATDNKYALDWRERCRANLARRGRKLSDGDRIRLEAPVTFSDGHVGQEFVVSKRRRKLLLRDPTNGSFYRISRLMERAWSVVPVTKVHKTVFA
ncbi:MULTISPECIES: DUF6927 domain-containing protein [Sphingomonadaceae]|jgi:hypothetical protein|uniref:DUF6927 domain-containing protein n=3 Tax=root TaxID=1 RepID=A0A249N085_SPHXE|nr:MULTISPECIES: hypothetical protein [Sphingomonadaceae]ASY46837.1 hypothetical protein CJD35_20340 [Sphingobium xenophagum]RYM08051.1 hypothetical protein EWH12_17515 [Sphingobium cupriresistens]TNE45007.1 MAG: hypothetical protein EP345_02155 [Sphingomonadales bacterium]GBH33081.1 hypothetical protein MBESOW_P4246 [Sphingobium xenophagum]|tara:strand:+ start:7770 stop:8381 length:612 start_codon:yes stop_codon:yes gene_type:complete